MFQVVASLAVVAAPPAARSPLWGDLTPGPHPIGFQTIKARDLTRSSGTAAQRSVPAGQGYPLLISYWYPAASPGGTPMTFAGYQAAGIVDEQLQHLSPQRLAATDADLKAFYERPFNFPFGAVEPERWARLGPTPLMAVADAPARSGRFPLLVGVGIANGNQVLGEYLASYGYVVALVFSPANGDLAPAARMEWFTRDLEFAMARVRELPIVDATRVATWGFSFAGLPALLAAARSPDVDAVVSLESALFSQPFTAQLVANPFYDPGNVRVPVLHMMRAAVSQGELAGFASLRYSNRIRYQLNDTTLVHQDFGTHGMAAAAVLGKRPAAERAARLAQRANAEYVRHFLDAVVKGDREAAAWLERTPEANGIPGGALVLDRQSAVVPAPGQREVTSWFEASGPAAIDRFKAAQAIDPLAPVFQERAINTLAYQFLANNRETAIAIFKLNIELYPASANTYDGLSEAYEAAGDSARAIELARKTIEVARVEAGLPAATRDVLERISTERIHRLGGR